MLVRTEYRYFLTPKEMAEDIEALTSDGFDVASIGIMVKTTGTLQREIHLILDTYPDEPISPWAN